MTIQQIIKTSMRSTFTFLNIRLLLLYGLLLAIASINLLFTIFINSLLILIFYELYKKNSRLLKLFLNVYIICNYLIFQVMIFLYKEILPWELGLVILFLMLYLYYFVYFNFAKQYQSPQQHKASLGLSVNDTKLYKCKLLNINLNLNDEVQYYTYIKCLCSLFALHAYMAQLTFTTLCTPIMVLEWFLIPYHCDLIYSSLYSSLCTACGFFCITLAVVLFFYITVNVKKYALKKL